MPNIMVVADTANAGDTVFPTERLSLTRYRKLTTTDGRAGLSPLGKAVPALTARKCHLSIV